MVLQIAALAPASSSFQATLRVGYPEHPRGPVLRQSRSPGRAARLCGRKVPSIERRYVELLEPAGEDPAEPEVIGNRRWGDRGERRLLG